MSAPFDAVAIMTDTDNTGATASAYYADITFTSEWSAGSVRFRFEPRPVIPGDRFPGSGGSRRKGSLPFRGASSRCAVLRDPGLRRTGGAVLGPELHPDEHRMRHVDEVARLRRTRCSSYLSRAPSAQATRHSSSTTCAFCSGSNCRLTTCVNSYREVASSSARSRLRARAAPVSRPARGRRTLRPAPGGPLRAPRARPRDRPASSRPATPPSRRGSRARAPRPRWRGPRWRGWIRTTAGTSGSCRSPRYPARSAGPMERPATAARERRIFEHPRAGGAQCPMPRPRRAFRRDLRRCVDPWRSVVPLLPAAGPGADRRTKRPARSLRHTGRPRLGVARAARRLHRPRLHGRRLAAVADHRAVSRPQPRATRILCLNSCPIDAERRRVALNRVQARRVGFVFLVVAGIWFDSLAVGSAGGGRGARSSTSRALDDPPFVAGGFAVAGVDTGTDSGRPGLRPLSRVVVAMSLVVIAAPGVVGVRPGRAGRWHRRWSHWRQLFAVSTMMASRGVLVSTARSGAGDRRRSARTARARNGHRVSQPRGGGALRGAKRPTGATRRFTPAARPAGTG